MNGMIRWGVAMAAASGGVMALAQSADAVKSLAPVEVRESVVFPVHLPKRNVATGVEAANIDIPFSVSHVPLELVQAQAGRTLQDALRNVPGAQADSGFNGVHTQFFVLRGSIADSGTGSNRVLRDGVRMSNYPFVKAFVDSVDVLQGPGAALGLRSEPGGTVNLMSKQAEMANFGSVGVSAGGSGAMELSADINRVLSEEHELAARLVLTRSAASEWRHTPDKLDGVKLSVSQSEGNSYHLRLNAEATNQTYQPDYGIPALNGSPIDVPRDRQYGEPWDNSTTQNRIFDIHADVALSPDARLNMDWTHLEARSTSIKSGLTGNVKNASGDWGRFAAYEPGTDRLIDSVASTVESKHQWGGLQHTLMVGADYYRETLNQPSLTIPAANSPDINVFNPVFGLVKAPSTVLAAGATTRQNLESVALSVQDQVMLGEWTGVAGVRFVQQDFMYGTAGTKSVMETKWLPKVGVLRKLSSADSVYANAAMGMSPNQVSSSSNQSLPSRESRQLELGWKSLWNGGALASDVAVYQLDQSNMIADDQATASNFDFTVDGKARSRGLEASLTGDLTRRLQAKVAYAYTDARVSEHPVYKGKLTPNVAAHTLTLWGQYLWPVESDVQWLTGAGIYAQTKRYADRANTTELPGYVRLDITQTWRTRTGTGKSVEVQLAIRNVLDAYYYVSSHLHVARWITPAEGRNASLSVHYRF
ncbi:TonB-dependent siderophore receptor [Rhodoferax sp.]|uniref:TonB-dependent receptor n=1 Tax=Rhodoferax sp. TaxID=50421 RepID=UPI002ACE5E98|nr:TonB-dependent siderophore receptor [Rhodoferax sp.]MDZ7922175.1 TonB-dependent siderophore receptor [Rhodoferax sp.]